MKERNYFGSRWGGDRICPNGPDEGTSRRVWKTRRARVRMSKSDSPRPKGGFAPIRGWFFSCFHTQHTPSRIGLRAHCGSWISKIIFCRGSDLPSRGLQKPSAVQDRTNIPRTPRHSPNNRTRYVHTERTIPFLPSGYRSCSS